MPKELRVIPQLLPDVSPESQQAERSRLMKLASVWRAANCWSANQVRHTYATEVRKDFGLEAAQVALGHSHADVTQTYAERNLSLAVEVAKAVG